MSMIYFLTMKRNVQNNVYIVTPLFVLKRKYLYMLRLDRRLEEQWQNVNSDHLQVTRLWILLISFPFLYFLNLNSKHVFLLQLDKILKITFYKLPSTDGCMALWLKCWLWYPLSGSALASDSSSLLVQTLHGSKWWMAQVLWPLPSLWKIWIEFLAPGHSLTQPRPTAAVVGVWE